MLLQKRHSHSFKLSCDTLNFVRERNIFIPVMVLYWTIHDTHNNEFMAEFEIPSFCHLKHEAPHFLALSHPLIGCSLKLCHWLRLREQNFYVLNGPDQTYKAKFWSNFAIWQNVQTNIKMTIRQRLFMSCKYVQPFILFDCRLKYLSNELCTIWCAFQCIKFVLHKCRKIKLIICVRIYWFYGCSNAAVVWAE